MRNKIDDLRNHLFETIELLKEGSIEIDKAHAIADCAQVIVNSVKMEVDYIRALNLKTTSGFIPSEERKGERLIG
jgi:hypothetical protein